MFDETQLQYEIVRVYMDREVDNAIAMCRNYINSKHGQVDDDFFQMLFAMYETTNNKIQFIKLAKTYSDLTGKVRKTWIEKEEIEIVSNKNLFISNGALDVKSIETLQEFYMSCLSKKFGRIDFNKLNIIKSNYLGLHKLLDILYALKKSDVFLTIMGDNKILNFNMNQFNELRNNSEKAIDAKIKEEETQQNINKLLNKKTESGTFLKNTFNKKELLASTLEEIDKLEKIVYLLKLEILQWKGYEKEHNRLALDYHNRFDLMPPEYHREDEKIKLMNTQNKMHTNNGIVLIDKQKGKTIGGVSSIQNEVLKYLVKEINSQNINYLLDYLNATDHFIITLDFSNVDYFTYDAAHSLLSFLKTYRKNNAKQYIIHINRCNKMIEIMFRMFGLENYVTINQ